MPFIEVKVFEDELDQQQKSKLIEGITSLVTDLTNEKMRDLTWVVINEVKSGNWGVAGNPVGLEDVKRIVSGD